LKIFIFNIRSLEYQSINRYGLSGKIGSIVSSQPSSVNNRIAL